jgi:hypothetical protein
MKPVAPTVEPRATGSVLGSTPDLASPAYIISELLGIKDQMGVHIGDGDYDWSRRAVLFLREAHSRGEVLCAFGATWCDPAHRHYKEFNERWERLGRPVNS